MTAYIEFGKKDRKKHPIRWHYVIAENMMGGKIPDGFVVHHIDEDIKNNSEKNLMICHRGFHSIIHARINAKKACGESWWKKCTVCKSYDHPDKLQRTQRGGWQHHACHKQRVRAYYYINLEKERERKRQDYWKGVSK